MKLWRTNERTKKQKQKQRKEEKQEKGQQEEMSKTQQQEEEMMAKKTEECVKKARWMLEGSHGMTRDADTAVVLLEDLVNKDRNTEAMWMLGVCCEFGIGTQQDVERAEQLFQNATQQGNTTAELLTGKLKNNNGRGQAQMDLDCEQNNE